MRSVCCHNLVERMLTSSRRLPRNGLGQAVVVLEACSDYAVGASAPHPTTCFGAEAQAMRRTSIPRFASYHACLGPNSVRIALRDPHNAHTHTHTTNNARPTAPHETDPATRRCKSCRPMVFAAPPPQRNPHDRPPNGRRMRPRPHSAFAPPATQPDLVSDVSIYCDILCWCVCVCARRCARAPPTLYPEAISIRICFDLSGMCAEDLASSMLAMSRPRLVPRNSSAVLTAAMTLDVRVAQSRALSAACKSAETSVVEKSSAKTFAQASR